MAFGDNGPRKKTGFEHLTRFVMLIMIIVTVAAIVLGALAAIF
ncbi:DUF4044 domain-containing protein [Streptococcus tangpeifui]|nr:MULTISPECIES: DUF4044 domain-containing protein [unclassified Streptococcus]